MSERITLQKIFDLAWQRFIVEDGLPSLMCYRYNKSQKICKYLCDDGRRCAVGLALPDGHEALELDGDFPYLIDQYPELFDESFAQLTDEYLIEFQNSLHDDLAGVDANNNAFWLKSKEERIEVYREVAKKYNLSLPEGL